MSERQFAEPIAYFEDDKAPNEQPRKQPRRQAAAAQQERVVQTENALAFQKRMQESVLVESDCGTAYLLVPASAAANTERPKSTQQFVEPVSYFATK